MITILQTCLTNKVNLQTNHSASPIETKLINRLKQHHFYIEFGIVYIIFIQLYLLYIIIIIKVAIIVHPELFNFSYIKQTIKIISTLLHWWKKKNKYLKSVFGISPRFSTYRRPSISYTIFINEWCLINYMDIDVRTY